MSLIMVPDSWYRVCGSGETGPLFTEQLYQDPTSLVDGLDVSLRWLSTCCGHLLTDRSSSLGSSSSVEGL